MKLPCIIVGHKWVYDIVLIPDSLGRKKPLPYKYCSKCKIGAKVKLGEATKLKQK